jgi:hypothetical protein
MPVFDWDGRGAPVPKTAFKYYLAITATLTVGVLIIWALAVSLPWGLWLAKRWRRASRSEEGVELTKLNYCSSESV